MTLRDVPNLGLIFYKCPLTIDSTYLLAGAQAQADTQGACTKGKCCDFAAGLGRASSAHNMRDFAQQHQADDAEVTSDSRYALHIEHAAVESFARSATLLTASNVFLLVVVELITTRDREPEPSREQVRPPTAVSIEYAQIARFIVDPLRQASRREEETSASGSPPTGKSASPLRTTCQMSPLHQFEPRVGVHDKTHIKCISSC